MYLLGYDIGSSSVKASVVDAWSGKTVAFASFPPHEAPILSLQAGWAEQEPSAWWDYLKAVTSRLLEHIDPADIAAIGLSYQMHGLVCIDRERQVLRPAIIWCDSRAVPYGRKAQEALGEDWCLKHLLNAPGNFTAAKLAWVKENEPQLYSRIWKILLPGDYIAMRLTGTASTTVSGLSEGIFWDFQENRPSGRLLDYFGFSEDILPEIVPAFGPQGQLGAEAAAELGLKEGTPLTYRAGDQPNNALSLGVLHPGEIASTAGTSGVLYGVTDRMGHDPHSRVNTFAHVNHRSTDPRLGVLLCINGCGILYAWLRRQLAPDCSYPELNALSESVPIGSDGISILPFGNGAERLLENRDGGCSIHGLHFNRHGRAQLLRAAQEGIVFSFRYGMEIMEQMGLKVNTIRAGRANMFQSKVFRDTLAGVSGATIELMDTEGSSGAAKGAGIGAGIYKNESEAFRTLEKIEVVGPAKEDLYREAYERWKSYINR